MDNMEEDNLFQMVHDFIESSSTTSSESTVLVSPKPLMIHHPKCFILQDLISSNTKEEEYEVLEAVMRHMRNNNKVSSMRKKKWLVMKLVKNGFNASLCQSSWPTTVGCPSGDYEYIDIVIGSNEQNTKRVIVDIDFKSQFEVARPTPAYKELTNTLPTIFVGDEQKLKKIISLLCSAAKQSLRERNLLMPPWRTVAYMQSKWFSPKTSLGRGGEESKGGEVMGSNGDFQELGMWTPPMPLVKPKRGFGGGSGF